MLAFLSAGSGRAAVLGMLALAGALGVVAYFGRPVVTLRPPAPPRRPTLAVVGFENLGGGPSLELMSLEVTEAVYERLSRLDDGPFALRPREQSFTFRGLEGGVEALSRALDAGYILTGSVRETDGAIEVDVYLVRVERETRIWAERFTRPVGERSAMADAVAARVAEALRDVR